MSNWPIPNEIFSFDAVENLERKAKEAAERLTYDEAAATSEYNRIFEALCILWQKYHHTPSFQNSKLTALFQGEAFNDQHNGQTA